MSEEYAVIAGYGLPGRAVAEALEARGVAFCVVERNVLTVSRCLRSGVRIIEGDVTDREVLEKAEIGRATLFAVTVPDEEVMLKAVEVGRAMNAGMKIIARGMYTSVGMKAMRAGANEVVIAEKLVAADFGRVVKGM
ncbi:MAG TPA: NAD(P)-binding protein [Tepidisphaeraceae bacterium]|nr:NAD(P)-binding protein [Tepidisphaeraceae bacterium]